MQILSPEYTHADKKGAIVQVATDKFEQYLLVQTFKGNTRGGHYHNENKETFTIITGRVELTIPHKDGTKNIYLFKNGDSFVIEPGDNHTLNFLDDTLMVELKKKPYDPADTYKS